jgi:hypothetical protein
MTYLSHEALQRKFGRRRRGETRQFEIDSYFEYQGKKFATLYDANSYIRVQAAMDEMDLEEQYGDLKSAFARWRGKTLVVSFDTSSLPDGATIVSATLRLRRGAGSGTNPFGTHGACYADIKGGTGFSGSVALQTGDFQAAADATQVATMSNPAADGDWSTGVLNATGRGFVNKTGKTQLRVYFVIDDNDDAGNDYIGYYSGNDSTAANRPVLEITYQ